MYCQRYYWKRYIYDYYGWIIGEVWYDSWYDEYVFEYDDGYTTYSYYLYPCYI
jgi:hypothetical protein